MKEYIEKLSLGTCEYENPVLQTSVLNIELNINSDSIQTGEFVVSTGNDKMLKGVVYSTHEKIRIINNTFFGKEISIKYEIDANGLIKGEEINGAINIVSNGGEITIPVLVNVETVSVTTSIGEVKNLFHFANLVQMSYDEAVSLFKSAKFPKVFLKEDFYLESVYEGLIGSTDIDLAMEEFLIASNKKTPVKLGLTEKEKQYEYLTENFGDTVVITKNNWGYKKVDVVVEGDFITGYKKKITTHDFAGSSYEFSYFIDIKRLNQGNNFGKIKFITSTETFTLDILVKAKTTLTRDSIDYQKYSKQLYRLYLDFRLRKIDTEKWADMSLAVIERMRTIDDSSYFIKLYQAQVEISKGRDAESAWILENVAESLIEKRNDNMDMYCYYLYVRTLQKRDSEFTDEVIKKIKDYFENGYDSYRLLWILMYLDESFDTNQSLKLARIKEQFSKGMTSSFMYYEAMRVFNEQPELLRILNDFEIQILCFGSKEGYISNRLANQLADVCMSIKSFNPLLLKILTTIYESGKNINILSAIVTMLIKGNKTDTKYFVWYEEAVEKEIKLTGLYEYFMYSIPEDYREQIPQIILMYFSYNTNISSNKLSVLYRNIIENKDSNANIYEAYTKQMNYYSAEGILNGAIDENVAVVYEDVLKKAMVTKEMAAKLPAIINTYVIKCDNKNMRYALVLHKEMRECEQVPIVDGKAYVTIYTSEPAIIFADFNGNRYCKTIEYTMEKLLDMEDYLKICYEITAEDLGLTLYYTDKYIMFHKDKDNSIGILEYITKESRIRDSYRLYIENEIIEYYSSNYDGDRVDDYLLGIDDNELSRTAVRKIEELMIVRGMYDKVWDYIRKYGYMYLETRKILKFVNKRIIETDFRNDRLLVEIAGYLFRKGKYNENILHYLSLYFYGTTEEMYNLWLRCNEYEFVDREMCEKLIAQMLFTKNYINKAQRVYKVYKNVGATTKIKKAFLFYKSYEYFVHDAVIEDEIYDYIFEEIKDDNPLPELCGLAYTKYCSELETLNDEQLEICKNTVESMCAKDRMFNFFKRFDKYFKLPVCILDKTFVEYYTSSDSKVLIHYQLETGSLEKKEYKVSKMNSIYSGVFTKDFILFYGEKINYYITEEINGETKVNESRSLTVEEDGFTSKNTRYGMLNDMMVCADMKEENTLKDLTMQYVAALELNDSIFSVM